MKKTLSTLLFSSFLFSISNTYALSDIESLAVFQTNMKKNAASIWPGLTIGKRPMIVAMSKPNDGLYAFDLTTQNAKWQKQILQGVPVNYMQHDSVGAHAFLNNADASIKFFMLENKPATVMSLWDESSYSDQINKELMSLSYYMAYELHDSPNAKAKLDSYNQLFHGKRIRFDSFNNPEVFSLLYVEISILKEYLTTQNGELLKSLAAVQQYRTQLLNENAKQYETSEDLPLCFYYVYFKSLEMNGVDSAKAILDQYLNMLNPYISNNGKSGQIIPDEFYEEYGDMLRVIYMSEQYAMDKLVPDWKNSVEAKNIAPGTLFLQHYSLSDSEAKSLTEAAKAHYGYAEFIQKINEPLQPYLVEMQQLKAAYDTQAGIEFIFKRQQEGAHGGSVSTYSKEYQIDSLTTLGTASMGMSTDDNNMDFDADNTPMYVMSQQDFHLKFKLAPDTLVSINAGKAITVAQLVQGKKPVQVKQLTIKGNGEKPVAITAKLKTSAATLSVVNGKVEISYIAK